MFYFRIDRVRFFDNGGVKSGLGIFGHDFAKVKFLSFVTRSDQSVPELDEWMQNNDAASKKTMLQTLVNDALSTRVLTRDRSGARQRAGELWRHWAGSLRSRRNSGGVHVDISCRAIVARSSRGRARDVNEMLSEPDFASFSKDLLGLIQTGSALANPAYAAGVAVAKFVAQASARRLMKKGDRQLGAISESFIRSEHYPQGIRESHDVHDATGNMFYDYSLFGYKRAIPVIRKTTVRKRPPRR